MVDSRRQAGGRNGGLQSGQRVRHETFEEVAGSQSLHLLWPRTAMRRVGSPGLSFLNERQVELRDESPAVVPTFHSNSVSPHCTCFLVLRALMPAGALFQILICQIITTYIVKSLRTTTLIEVSSPNVQ